ncbi:CIC_collapsed_G0026170.mRNA.1.CDS.1 [Saccharomyces cerevisiae]|nr:CIC_collapsed_G0026170.mRNA.1.CDS.1 [Saccharomyces cerevisiae]
MEVVNALYTSAARYEVSEVFSLTHVEVGTSPFFRYNIVPFTLKQWKEAIASNFCPLTVLIVGRVPPTSRITIKPGQLRDLLTIRQSTVKYLGKLLTLRECSLTGTLPCKPERRYKELMIYGYDFQFIDLDSDQICYFTKEYEDKTLFAAF